MSYHLPKEPCPEIMATILRYKVDIKKGTVCGIRGKEIFKHINNKGYKDTTIYGEGKRRIVSRAHVIWWAHTGEWPKDMLDHIDRDRTNDSITNLRYTNCVHNRLNSNQHHSGKVMGVCKQGKSFEAWYAKTYLGRYTTEAKAHNAYLQAKEQVTKWQQ